MWLFVLVGSPRQHPYVAGKHGLVSITKSMALDWAPEVRVNAVAPGYVRTELIEEAVADDSIRKSLLRRTPLDGAVSDGMNEKGDYRAAAATRSFSSFWFMAYVETS